MENFTRKTLVLQTICGLSFLRFILHEHGFPLSPGFLLATKDSRDTTQIMNTLNLLDDAVIYQNWNTQSIHPLNYETGVLCYNRYIKDSFIYNFLHQEDFLPLLVVGGIIPDFLRDEYLIVPFEISDNTFFDFLCEYRLFKTFVLENLEYVIREINLFKTEALYNNNHIPSNFVLLYRTLVVTGKVWKLFEKNNLVSEQTYESHYHEYTDYIIKLLNNTERFENEYEIREAIRKIVISYVETNSILIVDTTQVTNGVLEQIEQKHVILEDLKYYYFPEKFFQKICKPLLENVSFLQLKHEMYKENILVCDESKQRNFTVKKMYFNTDTGESQRMRFLKFPKSIFETDEGLPLNMIVNTKPRVNIVKPFKPKGGNTLCISKLEN